MDWVAVQHPYVAAVNLSLGSDEMFPGHCDASTAWTQELAAGVDALVANGAVVTVSTGNQRKVQQLGAPACIRNALSVAPSWDSDLGEVDAFLGCRQATTAQRHPPCSSPRTPPPSLSDSSPSVHSPCHP